MAVQLNHDEFFPQRPIYPGAPSLALPAKKTGTPSILLAGAETSYLFPVKIDRLIQWYWKTKYFHYAISAADSIGATYAYTGIIPLSSAFVTSPVPTAFRAQFMPTYYQFIDTDSVQFRFQFVLLDTAFGVDPIRLYSGDADSVVRPSLQFATNPVAFFASNGAYLYQVGGAGTVLHVGALTIDGVAAPLYGYDDGSGNPHITACSVALNREDW